MEPTRDQIAQDYSRALAIIDGLRDQNAELLAALKEVVEWHGAVHGQECPADDTCDCIGGDLNRRVNAAIAKAEGR